MNSGSWKSKEMIRLILSIVLLAIGIILLMAPNTAMAVIVVIIGVVVLAYGVIQLFTNISRRNRGDANASYVVPIIAIIVGILLIIFRDGIANIILPFIIGVWAIITGIMSLMAVSYTHLVVPLWNPGPADLPYSGNAVWIGRLWRYLF